MSIIEEQPKKLLHIYGNSLQPLYPSTIEYLETHGYIWVGMQELKPAIRRNIKYMAEGIHCGNECIYIISYLDGRRHMRDVYIKKAKVK